MQVAVWTANWLEINNSQELLQATAKWTEIVADQGNSSYPRLLVLPATSLVLAEAELLKVRQELQDLASRHNIYIVPGSMLLQQGKSEFIRYTEMISPKDSVVVKSVQTHLLPEEQTEGLLPGEDVYVGDTEFGPVAILMHTDVAIPELWRIITLKGAKLVICLSEPREYSLWEQLAGVWQQVQQNQVMGLEVSRQPGLYAPCEATPGERGILELHRRGGLLTAELDLDQVDQVRKRYPLLGQLNGELYSQWLPGIYRGEFK